jgi:hypothetical protein
VLKLDSLAEFAVESWSSQPQGVVFRSSPKQLDPNRPTVVVTHGWQPTSGFIGAAPSWVEAVKEAIMSRAGAAGGREHYNILEMIWPEAFTGDVLAECRREALTIPCILKAAQLANAATAANGHKLAEYLKSRLPIGYSRGLHLIGHSFGAVVNAFAFRELAFAGVFVSQVTLLDAPMEFAGFSIYPAEWFQLAMPYPSTCTWIDNYYGGQLWSFGTELPGAYNLAVDESHTTIQEQFYLKTIERALGVTYSGFDFSLDGGAYDQRPDPQCWHLDMPLVEVLATIQGVVGDGWMVVEGFAESAMDTIKGSSQSVVRLLERSSSVIASDVTIPADAAYLRILVSFPEQGDGDWLTIHFNGTLIFSGLGSDFRGPAYHEFVLPLHQLRSTKGQLVAALNGTGNPDAEVRIGPVTIEKRAQPDNTAPTTAATTEPLPNSLGWHNSSVIVTLGASDNIDGTGVRELSYATGGAQATTGRVPDSRVSLTVSAEGLTAITYFAVDNAGNQETPKTVVLRVDKTAPVPPIASVSPTPSADGWSNAPSVTIDFVANGDIGPVQSGGVACTGPTSVTAETTGTVVSGICTDAAGNASSATSVTVKIDRTPPTITNVPANLVADATSAAGTPISYATPTATDLVDGAVAVTCMPVSGAAFPLGTSTVNCTATDHLGNTAGSSLLVTVRDTTAPSLAIPSPLTAEGTSPAGAVVAFTASAKDAVDPAPNVVCAPASGAVFPLGATTVNCTATDASNNRATDSFTVTVRDTTVPTLSCVPVDPGKGFYRVTAEDACSSPTLTLGGTTLGTADTIRITHVTVPGGVQLVSDGSLKQFYASAGGAVLTARDSAGNTTQFTCPVVPTDTCISVDFREITYFRGSRVIMSSDAAIRVANGVPGGFDASVWPYDPKPGRERTTSQPTLFRIYGFKADQVGARIPDADVAGRSYPVLADPDVPGAYYADLGGPARVIVCVPQLQTALLDDSSPVARGTLPGTVRLSDEQKNVRGITLNHNAREITIPKRVRAELAELGTPLVNEAGKPVAHGVVDYVGFQLWGHGTAQYREFVDVEIRFLLDDSADRVRHYTYGLHTLKKENFETGPGCNYLDSAPGNDGFRLNDMWKGSKAGDAGWGAACGRREPSQNQRVRENYAVPLDGVQLLPTVNTHDDTARLYFGKIRVLDPAGQADDDYAKHDRGPRDDD